VAPPGELDLTKLNDAKRALERIGLLEQRIANRREHGGVNNLVYNYQVQNAKIQRPRFWQQSSLRKQADDIGLPLSIVSSFKV